MKQSGIIIGDEIDGYYTVKLYVKDTETLAYIHQSFITTKKEDIIAFEIIENDDKDKMYVQPYKNTNQTEESDLYKIKKLSKIKGRFNKYHKHHGKMIEFDLPQDQTG